MVKLPVSKETMPYASLAEAGALILRTIEAADKPFDEQLARGDAPFIDVAFDTPGQDGFHLGSPAGLKLKLGTRAEALLDIIWPDESDAQRSLLKDFDLSFRDDRQIYLAFTSKGRAEVGAEGTFPSGPLSASFGIAAGGEVTYTYLKPSDRTLPAGEALRRFFKGLRLPHDVRSAGDIPEEGEVLHIRYDGYLTAGVAAGWGYSVSTYRGLDLNELALRQKIDIASALAVSANVRIAGHHGLEVRRGAAPGWVRVIARKYRESGFGIAADIGIQTTLETSGLPEDANQFLEALLDLRTPAIVREIAGLLQAGPEALFERLHDETGGLTERFLGTLFEKWFDKALSRDEAQAFFERLQRAIRLYEDLKETDEKIIAVLETYAGQGEKLEALIDTVLHLPDRAGLQQVTDAALWRFLQQYLDDKLFAFLTSDETFEETKARLASWNEKGWKTLLPFIEARQEALGLPTLLRELDDLLSRLDAFDTPEEVRDEAEGHLLDLAHRLTGTALDTLKDARLNEELKALQSLLSQLGEFKKRLYDRFAAAINDTHKLNLSWHYAKAREKSALVDVEINVQSEQGEPLLRHALGGDFAALTRLDDPSLVRVNAGLLTARLQSSNRLKIDVLGWRYEWLRELVFHTEETVRQQGEGLLHVYHLTADEQTTRRKRDEEIKRRFLFGLWAEGRAPDLIDTVSRLAVDYSFDIADVKTSEKELRAYLRLAEHLRMIPRGRVEDLLETFRRELGREETSGWGAVTVQYQVRYDPEALMGVFRLLPRASLNGITRQAFRNIVSANYRSYGGARHAAIADLILSDRIYQAWKTGKARLASRDTFCYEIEGEMPKVCIDWHGRRLLRDLYDVEDELVEALFELDQVLDSAREAGAKPSKAALEDAFRRLAKQRRKLEKRAALREADRYVDPFFAILDQLVSVFSEAKATRATMQLTFEQKNLKPVMKILVADATHEPQP